MSDIQIKMKDGTVKKFPHENRPGGSWSNSIKYEGAFVVVTNAWGKSTAFPAADVAEVTETPLRY